MPSFDLLLHDTFERKYFRAIDINLSLNANDFVKPTGVFECFRQETSSFGIRSVLFQLGFFRTKIMDPANFKVDPSSAIGDYSELSNIVNGFVGKMNGNQPGDPQKAVTIMIDIVKGEGVGEGKEMPERLPIGPDILEKIRARYTNYLKVCDKWETVIKSTDLDDDERGAMRTVVVGDDA